MNEKLNIDFYPIKSGMNPYIEIVKESLKSQMDCNIKEFVYSEKYYLKNRDFVDVVYMNWYENVQTDSTLRTLLRALRRIEMLWLIKMCGIKTIVVIHNRIPHDSKNVNLIRWFSKRIYQIADRLVILSKGTVDICKADFGKKYYKKIDKKLVLVPHPDYYGVYPEKNLNFRNVWRVNKGDFVYLFFGNIAPYKNVEIFIEAAHKISKKNTNTKFIIMGKCNSEYKEAIIKRIGENKNIVLFPQMIDDSDLTSVIRSANVVVMPLDKESSLNSTTVFLTLSCGINVVCPRIACVSDFEGALYDYDYSNTEEHLRELVKACEMVYEEYSMFYQTYMGRIERFKNILSKDHSKETIGKKLANTIKKVIAE